MRTPSDKISTQEAEEALLRSGYLLESRLDRLLRRQGYYVEANAAYPDPETGKSRELDLFAISAWRAGPQEFDSVFAVLLVECINNPQPAVFITKEPQVASLHHYEVKMAGLPVKVPVEGERDSWESLADYLGMDKYHHYCKGRIATQFCSFTKKKDTREWMAMHEEMHFDSFRKLSEAVEHSIDEHFKSWRANGDETVNIEFYYPVVVLQGELLEARPAKKRSVRLIRTDHVQHRRSAFLKKEATEYQIDVVTERFFPKYLDIIGEEMAKTARLLRRRHLAVRKAIDRIVRSAQRLRSPDKIRAALEF